MNPYLYTCWILPVHRVAAQAILASYRYPCRKRAHLQRQPAQECLFA